MYKFDPISSATSDKYTNNKPQKASCCAMINEFLRRVRYANVFTVHETLSPTCPFKPRTAIAPCGSFSYRHPEAFGHRTPAMHHSEQRLITPLSKRELELLRLISAGHTNKEIASELFITIGTVKRHTVNIFNKLDVNNRTKAVAKARELGLL